MERPFALSIFVVACDEEENLRRCLESVADLAREVVVVDSGSRDRTVAVAESAGARVIAEPWRGMRDQKNFALGECRQPWVLSLDADEELSAGLRVSVERFLEEGGRGAAGASFARRTRFLGRWITHGDWYPDVKTRLARREAARFEGEAGHDRMVVAGRVVRLEGDLHHYSFPTLNRFLEKMSRFGDAFLEREVERGARWSLAATLLRPAWRFVRSYVLRRGFLDGFPGFWVASGIAFQTFVRYSRLYEHEHGDRPVESSDSGAPVETPSMKR